MNKRGGFSLVEILVVIAILGVLLAVVLIAINPQAPTKQSHNVVREAAVSSIINAVHSYAQQHEGELPSGITTSIKMIASDKDPSNVDLCAALVPTYLSDIPLDPTTGTEAPAGSVCTQEGAGYNSGYTIFHDQDGKVTVTAPAAEDGSIIDVTR